jgi:rRNA-processing protein FCF1
MYSEENKSSSLAKFLAVYDYVFVDTCSLMEDSFPMFMDTLAASKEYWKEGLRVIVIGECVQELKKHAKSKDKETQEARIEAKRALKILHHDKWHGKTLEITKPTTNDGFADHALFTQVSSLRIQNKILIITQDKTLATDLKKLNALDSQHGRFLAVYRLNPEGDLVENPGETDNYHNKENVRPSVSNESKYDNHRGHGFFHRHDHFERTAEREHEPEVEKPIEEDSPIAQADRRLCANLMNPNYPSEKKIADINSQLGLLGQLTPSDLSKLSLAYTVEQLKAELAKLGGTVKPAAPAPVKVAEAPKAAPLAKPVEKSLEKPAIKPAEKPVVKESPRPHAWFEYGRTIQEAVASCGTHEGLMFRDPSIPFFKGVHGPIDLTTKDLDKVAADVGVLKAGEAKEVSLATYIVHVEKTDKDYKVYFAKPEAKAVEAVKPVAPAAPKAVEAPKAVPSPKKEEKKPVEEKPVRHIRAKKAPEIKNEDPSLIKAPNSNIAEPAGATLIVGVPNDDTKAYIERKSRREDGKDLSIVRRDGSKAPDQIAPAPKAKRPGAKKVAEPVKKAPAPKKSEPVKKAAAPKQAKKVITPKANKAAPAKKAAPSADLASIIKIDKNMNAKINNPNYPVENKIADLEAQAVLVSKLSPADEKKLFFSTSKIKAKLAELGKK